MNTREEQIRFAKTATIEQLLGSIFWAGVWAVNEKEEYREYSKMVEEIAKAEILRRTAQ